MSADFPTGVFRFCASRGWNPADAALLLCVSGGADSVALLHLFARAARTQGLTLAAVHVDHRLRPESEEDAAFVADLCRRLSVPLRVSVLDPTARPKGESVEMWARRERYRAFETAASAAHARWILTAHHRDDLVETVFQRLGRGTGARGLQGIPFRRGAIHRPFLDRSRGDILAYLDSLGAGWREDASNADVSIDRNWYRHRYLPALRAAEPRLDARIAALALGLQSIAKAFDTLEAEAGLLQYDGDGRPRLEHPAIAALIREGDGDGLRYWLRELVREGVGRASGTREASSPVPGSRTPMVTQEILREFLRQWETGRETLQVPVASGLALKCEKRGIYCMGMVSKRKPAGVAGKNSCLPQAQRVILVGGSGHASWRWNGREYSLDARSYPRPAGLVFPTSMEERAIFDADLFSCTLLIRTRLDGDRFSPLGLRSRSRKLKTFFNEEKVPAAMRDSLPIVLSCHAQDAAMPGEVPAWIPGLGISDFYKVGGTTSHILELVLTCENP